MAGRTEPLVGAIFQNQAASIRYSKALENDGEVPERSKGLAWKASVPFTLYRGFESHPLRQSSVQCDAAADADVAHAYSNRIL